MSILRDPPHVVQLQRMKRSQSVRGTYEDVPEGEPIDVPCSVQAVREWSSAEEIPVDGLQVLTLCRVFAADWPGDIRSIVRWDGHVWETVGDPQHFTQGRRTHHWAVTIRKRGED